MALQPSGKHNTRHFIIFCIFQMVSCGRLYSLLESGLCSLVLKKKIKDRLFAIFSSQNYFSVNPNLFGSFYPADAARIRVKRCL